MAPKDVFEPASLPTPDRPWNHAIAPMGTPLYISGQTPVDSAGNVVHRGDLTGQFAQALENVGTVLEAAGGSMGDLTALTIYVTDMEAWRAEGVGDIRYDLLEEPYPCSTLIGITELARPEYLVEIEGVAHLPPEA